MVNPIYPARSFMRFQAKRQLAADISGQQVMSFVSRGDNRKQMDLALPDSNTVLPNDSHPNDSHPNDSDPNDSDPNDLLPNHGSSSDVANPLNGAQAVGSMAAGSMAAGSMDDGLLQDIATLVFHPDQHPEIYQPCQSREDASAIEQAIAREIVATYKRIKANEHKPNIQKLNAML